MRSDEYKNNNSHVSSEIIILAKNVIIRWIKTIYNIQKFYWISSVPKKISHWDGQKRRINLSVIYIRSFIILMCLFLFFSSDKFFFFLHSISIYERCVLYMKWTIWALNDFNDVCNYNYIIAFNGKSHTIVMMMMVMMMCLRNSVSC